MAEKSILNMFKTTDIPQTEYNNLIITEEKFKNLVELLEQYRRCGKDIKNEELTLILQVMLNKQESGSCAFKEECRQQFENENEEALVQGVEFGLDNNLYVDPKDIEKYEKYKKITYRK